MQFLQLSKAIKQTRSFHKTTFQYLPKGTIKFFNTEKGYGFITQESGEDVFFHISGFGQEGLRTVHQGQTVNFELGQGRQGTIAKNISLEESQ